MKYDLFLFDADDTLFDFAASEFKAFSRTLRELGHQGELQEIFRSYKAESDALWRLVEKGEMPKHELKGERYRRTFTKHGLPFSGDAAGSLYLEILAETFILIDHARELCQFLTARGKVAIITNGFESVQTKRLKLSGLESFVSFMIVSEACGFAKPDRRFFDFTAERARELSGGRFDKSRTLVIGDRIETDIMGAHEFGVSACWFNPTAHAPHETIRPKFEVRHLSEIKQIAEHG